MHFVNHSFLAGINVAIEYSLASSACKFVSAWNVNPLIRAFMSDLNLMSSSVSSVQIFQIEVQQLYHGQVYNSELIGPAVLLLCVCVCVCVCVRGVGGGKSMNITRFYVTEPSTPSDYTNFISSMHLVSANFLVKSLIWFPNRSKLN